IEVLEKLQGLNLPVEVMMTPPEKRELFFDRTNHELVKVRESDKKELEAQTLRRQERALALMSKSDKGKKLVPLLKEKWKEPGEAIFVMAEFYGIAKKASSFTQLDIWVDVAHMRRLGETV